MIAWQAYLVLLAVAVERATPTKLASTSRPRMRQDLQYPSQTHIAQPRSLWRCTIHLRHRASRQVVTRYSCFGICIDGAVAGFRTPPRLQGMRWRLMCTVPLTRQPWGRCRYSTTRITQAHQPHRTHAIGQIHPTFIRIPIAPHAIGEAEEHTSGSQFGSN